MSKGTNQILEEVKLPRILSTDGQSTIEADEAASRMNEDFIIRWISCKERGASLVYWIWRFKAFDTWLCHGKSLPGAMSITQNRSTALKYLLLLPSRAKKAKYLERSGSRTFRYI